MKKILVCVAVLFLLVLLYVCRDKLLPFFFTSASTEFEVGEVDTAVSQPEVVVQGLNIPWEIVFLPDGDMLVTERAGRLLRMGSDKKTIEVSGVAHRGEGGLLGLALHPNFAQNGWIYLYLTTSTGGGLSNRVERYVLEDAILSERQVIIENIPGAANHDGGRIAFGPDRLLYIATGDAGNAPAAQNTSSLAGKILRIKDDGSIPEDNPFGNAVYSFGHRNVQGLAWDASGQLWATEHGRSGAQSGYDELNKIIKGGNYGWPVVQGDATQTGMISPQLHSGASETWAPSGMTIVQGRVVFVGLRGEAVYVARIEEGVASDLEVYLQNEYGRLRTIAQDAKGVLYLLTNNTDGRGRPTETDDRVIKIDPALFRVF